MSHPPLRHQRGMTLLEVMLAVFISVLIFGAALSSIIHVATTVASAKNRLRAVALLNLQMEEMRSMTFARLQARLGDAAFTSGTVAAPNMTGTSARAFRWTRTVPAAAADDPASMVKVVVTIEWDELTRTRSIRSFSYFSKDGVLAAESTS